MEWQIAFIGPALAELQQIESKSRVLGIQPLVSQARRIIEGKLRVDPRSFGNRYNHLRMAKLMVYSMVESPLIYHDGVHDEEPVVIVQKVTAFSGWGLD